MLTSTATNNWLVAFGVGNNQNAEAIMNQGLNDINNLISINPDDIDIICNLARKPGGTISNGV